MLLMLTTTTPRLQQTGLSAATAVLLVCLLLLPRLLLLGLQGPQTIQDHATLPTAARNTPCCCSPPAPFALHLAGRLLDLASQALLHVQVASTQS